MVCYNQLQIKPNFHLHKLKFITCPVVYFKCCNIRKYEMKKIYIYDMNNL